ncbi:MAG: hypothetical protein SOW59_02285 [Corynebacterium sp.]|nr:hypothetical protein [Corynebacterium sp.]
MTGAQKPAVEDNPARFRTPPATNSPTGIGIARDPKYDVAPEQLAANADGEAVGASASKGLTADEASGIDLSQSKDHWLDDVTEVTDPIFTPTTRLAYSTFAGPARLLRRLWAFSSTTPGKLFAATVILTIAIAAAGISMSNSTASRQDNLNQLLAVTEPTASHAHNLYSSLSLADTIAATSMIQGGEKSEPDRKNYNEAIDRAAISAVQALQGAEDNHSRELITTIQRQLPVYTGLVESARANYRASNPVAAAYMSNASALMREEILPAAAELFAVSSSKVSAQQRELTSPLWVPLSGLVAAVGFLIIAQWWLWRLTRRRFNRGFLTATGLLTLATLWVLIANLAMWTAGSQGFEEAARPWASLTNARIAGQQARTSETLALVQRHNASDTAVPFDEVTSTISSALDDFEASDAIVGRTSTATEQTVKAARTALFDWSRTHSIFMASLRAGRYEDALFQATEHYPTPDEPQTSAAAFNTLDGSLLRLIADSRETMRSFITNGLAAISLLASAVFLITIAAIVAVWLGIRPRLQEYL